MPVRPSGVAVIALQFSISGIRVIRPILVGQMVTLKARIVHTGKTSMHIFISIEAGDPRLQNTVETGHCIMTFVASDEAGYPVAVPSWQPVNERDKLLEQYAIKAKNYARTLDKDLLVANDNE